MTTQCTIAYTATKRGPVTLTQLAAAMAAISLDPSVPNLFGATLTSDTTTTPTTSTAKRTMVWNISSAAFQANFPPGTDQAAIFHGLYKQTLSGFLRSIIQASVPVVS